MNHANFGGMRSFCEEMRSCLKCSICLQIMKHPLDVGCGHNFCGECISRWIQQNVERGSESQCPICQRGLDAKQFRLSLHLSSVCEIYAKHLPGIEASFETPKQAEAVVIHTAGANPLNEQANASIMPESHTHTTENTTLSDFGNPLLDVLSDPSLSLEQSMSLLSPEDIGFANSIGSDTQGTSLFTLPGDTDFFGGFEPTMLVLDTNQEGAIDSTQDVQDPFVGMYPQLHVGDGSFRLPAIVSAPIIPQQLTNNTLFFPLPMDASGNLYMPPQSNSLPRPPRATVATPTVPIIVERKRGRRPGVRKAQSSNGAQATQMGAPRWLGTDVHSGAASPKRARV